MRYRAPLVLSLLACISSPFISAADADFSQLKTALENLGDQDVVGSQARELMRQSLDRISKALAAELKKKQWKATAGEAPAATLWKLHTFNGLISTARTLHTPEVRDALLDCLEFEFWTGDGPGATDREWRPELGRPAAYVLIECYTSQELEWVILDKIRSKEFNALSATEKNVLARVFISSLGKKRAEDVIRSAVIVIQSNEAPPRAMQQSLLEFEKLVLHYTAKILELEKAP